MRKYLRQLPGGFHENSWLTFCGATCSQSKLQVASGTCSQPSWRDTHMHREPGQEVTQGPGRPGLDPEPLGEPCSPLPHLSSDLATDSPTSLSSVPLARAGGQARRD